MRTYLQVGKTGRERVLDFGDTTLITRCPNLKSQTQEKSSLNNLRSFSPLKIAQFISVQQRIHESKPGGQAYQEQAGSLGKLLFQLRGGLALVGLDESVEDVTPCNFASIVPVLQKTQESADGCLFLYRSHGQSVLKLATQGGKTDRFPKQLEPCMSRGLLYGFCFSSNRLEAGGVSATHMDVETFKIHPQNRSPST